MEYQTLKISCVDHIAIVKINRPNALNSLNQEVLQELSQCINVLENDWDIDVVVVTGEGRAFVAGADICEMVELGVQESNLLAILGTRVFEQIASMSKPVIAAVNGFALGGGCELALSCDVRIASSKAKFGLPEVGLGIIPGFGGTQRLPRLVGEAKAKEMIFTGKHFSAEEALYCGLVNIVCEPERLMDQAMEMAQLIRKNGQLAVRTAKEAINRGSDVDLDVGIVLENLLFARCFSTEDQKEGMRAFMEKRKPTFKLK